MAQIKWDEEGSHLYHTGASKGVLCPFDTLRTGTALVSLGTVLRPSPRPPRAMRRLIFMQITSST